MTVNMRPMAQMRPMLSRTIGPVLVLMAYPGRCAQDH
jgi:hypothetical protein